MVTKSMYTPPRVNYDIQKKAKFHALLSTVKSQNALQQSAKKTAWHLILDTTLFLVNSQHSNVPICKSLLNVLCLFRRCENMSKVTFITML